MTTEPAKEIPADALRRLTSEAVTEIARADGVRIETSTVTPLASLWPFTRSSALTLPTRPASRCSRGSP